VGLAACGSQAHRKFLLQALQPAAATLAVKRREPPVVAQPGQLMQQPPATLAVKRREPPEDFAGE